MADCVEHGFTPYPGLCKRCQEESEQGLEPGSLGTYDQTVAQSNWRKRSAGYRKIVDDVERELTLEHSRDTNQTPL